MAKTIDEYMKLEYHMKIVPDTEDGGYLVCFPDLPGCLTCVESLDKAVEAANDAKREWIAAALEDGIKIPKPSNPEN